MKERSQLRRSRRYRNKRRSKKRFNNRRRKEGWIAPSQLAKVRFRIRIVCDLVKIFPIKYLAVEDVRFNHYKKRWGKHFSTVEIGKTKLYTELEKHGKVIKYQGWQTAEARKYWGILKSSAKDALTPESHANDALVMLCEVFGDNVDNSCIFMVWVGWSLQDVLCIDRTTRRVVFVHALVQPLMEIIYAKGI